MIPFEECRWLVKYRLRPRGGFIGIHRFEDRKKAGSTLLLVNQDDGEGLDWECQLIHTREELTDAMLHLLVRRVGTTLEHAEFEIKRMYKHMEAGYRQNGLSMRAS